MELDNIKVSIIMNCFNGEKYLTQSIQSVISQSHKKWELIFWDNMSIDNSRKIFGNFKDERLKYFKAEEHTILYKARNLALKKASGDFICFLDTDDYWENDKIEKQLKKFKANNKISIVYTNYYIVNEKLKLKMEYTNSKKLPEGIIAKDLLKFYCTGISTLMFKKEVFENKLFDERFHIIGDFDFVLNQSIKRKFSVVREKLVNYRMHDKNESLLNRERHIRELKIWFDENKKKELSNIEGFKNFKVKILELEITKYFLEKNYKQVFLKLSVYPISLKKIKFFIFFIIPNSFLKKLINY